MGDLPACNLTGVLSVYACARAREFRWSRVPSILQGRGLFPGNWLVQKSGRSSQQWGGNACPVTLHVISRDKDEKREKLCVYMNEKVHKSVWEEDISLLITKHYTQVSPVHIAVEPDVNWLVYNPMYPPFRGLCAVSGPTINSQRGAIHVFGGWLSSTLIVIIQLLGKSKYCIILQSHTLHCMNYKFVIQVKRH